MVTKSVNVIRLYTEIEQNNSRKFERRKFIRFNDDRLALFIRVVILCSAFLFNVIIFITWQSFHILYCLKTKYIQINHRAIVDIVTSKKFKENIQKIYKPIELDSKCTSAVDIYDEYQDESVSFVELSCPSLLNHISVDIVFVHGLHGSASHTWKQGEWQLNDVKSKKHILRIDRNAKNNNFPLDGIYDWNTENVSKTLSECWPKDWLPIDFPNARISAINYDTDPYLWGPLWLPRQYRTNLVHRANEMIKLLVKHQIGVNRPIVWIGHSKGGLYIKQIIVNALTENLDETRSIWQSTKSVLFYSVPHRGSPLANLNLPFLKQSIEMIEIRRNFPLIIKLHEKFVKFCTDGTLNIDVFTFLETKLTKLSVFYLRIIDYISGDPGIGDVCGLPLDHFNMCKPRHRNCILYKQLVKMIDNALQRY